MNRQTGMPQIALKHHKYAIRQKKICLHCGLTGEVDRRDGVTDMGPNVTIFDQRM